MPTLARTLVKVLPRLGFHVVDLGQGEAVISRRKDRAALKGVRLGGSGAHLLLDEEGSLADDRRLQTAAGHYLCTHHVVSLLQRHGVNVVFDVGANRGQYAQSLRQLGYRGRIVSFEPVPGAFRKLEKAAAADDDWQVRPFGLGSETATMPISVEWITMNSLLPPTDYAREAFPRFDRTGTEDIEIRRLDAVMDEAMDGIENPRPYLKMDTQGFDLQVFAGAGKRIAEFVGMQSEVAVLQLYEGSPRMAEAVTAYEAAGFEVSGLYPVTWEPESGRLLEFDCVLVRVGS